MAFKARRVSGAFHEADPISPMVFLKLMVRGPKQYPRGLGNLVPIHSRALFFVSTLRTQRTHRLFKFYSTKKASGSGGGKMIDALQESASSCPGPGRALKGLSTREI